MWKQKCQDQKLRADKATATMKPAAGFSPSSSQTVCYDAAQIVSGDITGHGPGGSSCWSFNGFIKKFFKWSRTSHLPSSNQIVVWKQFIQFFHIFLLLVWRTVVCLELQMLSLCNRTQNKQARPEVWVPLNTTHKLLNRQIFPLRCCNFGHWEIIFRPDHNNKMHD